MANIENKANISQKNRRAKVRKVLFDERDIPVNLNYINSKNGQDLMKIIVYCANDILENSFLVK